MKKLGSKSRQIRCRISPSPRDPSSRGLWSRRLTLRLRHRWRAPYHYPQRRRQWISLSMGGLVSRDCSFVITRASWSLKIGQRTIDRALSSVRQRQRSELHIQHRRLSVFLCSLHVNYATANPAALGCDQDAILRVDRIHERRHPGDYRSVESCRVLNLNWLPILCALRSRRAGPTSGNWAQSPSFERFWIIFSKKTSNAMQKNRRSNHTRTLRTGGGNTPRDRFREWSLTIKISSHEVDWGSFRFFSPRCGKDAGRLRLRSRTSGSVTQ